MTCGKLANRIIEGGGSFRGRCGLAVGHAGDCDPVRPEWNEPCESGPLPRRSSSTVEIVADEELADLIVDELPIDLRITPGSLPDGAHVTLRPNAAGGRTVRIRKLSPA